MGFGDFKLRLSSRFGSSSSATQSPMSPCSPLGPGSSKADYAYGLDLYASPTSSAPAQSYYDGNHGPPPPYHPESGSGSKEWPVDAKTPVPYNPTDSMGESPLKALEKHDIVIVLDDSHSMLVADHKSGRTRWDQAWDALATLVRVGSKYDRDGIEIHFLNQQNSDSTVKNEGDVHRLRKRVREPARNSCTPIGDVLDTLLLEYARQTGDAPGRSKVKKRIFLVITDGAPTDSPEEPIIRSAKFFQQGQFPLDQVGIQFIQVGDDPEATQFLEELDTGLTEGGNTRDIVDTIKSTGDDLEGDALIKALTGGFNRRQDKIGERRK
ncbi:hypothetical protein BJ322DRAFT_204390 [Thelephora terrestris]|uniref:VWFA domain-containing protein n=1 Tax=Thelephora terrestris TaxID=56493 RepID=A0A9P6H938_9AGAM|nr:hypothetical protein BJ322DRAFT_204390 [Thelephora terrestris]